MQTKIRLTFLVFCLCSFMLQGQTIVQQKSYTQNLDLFVGTWEYTNGAEVFKILLKKVNQDTSISYGECLIGDYYYSINGVILDNIIETNIPLSYNETTRKNIILYATNGKSKVEYIEPLKLRVRFKDKRLNRVCLKSIISLIHSNIY